ncbi:hypothetical protein [Sphingomonas sp.]|uniref:hypothetical protein n=1 Tax=Sphingomonas sp. TaxID=28214 RepID=UPI0031E0129F
MIDSFALLLTHGLMLVAAWRLLGRRDLDRDEDSPPAAPPLRNRGRARRDHARDA